MKRRLEQIRTTSIRVCLHQNVIEVLDLVALAAGIAIDAAVLATAVDIHVAVGAKPSLTPLGLKKGLGRHFVDDIEYPLQ